MKQRTESKTELFKTGLLQTEPQNTAPSKAELRMTEPLNTTPSKSGLWTTEPQKTAPSRSGPRTAELPKSDLNDCPDLSDAEVAELTSQLNFDRMWKNIAERIGREESRQEVKGAYPSCAGSAAPAGRRFRRRFRRRVRCLIAAAALILCLGGAVFAVQKGYFETFFGIEPLSGSQILRVNESQSSDGVRMTLAEVIPGETDGVITVAFEREDGLPFPENVELARFDALLDGEEIGKTTNKRLSGDRRQLLYCIEIDGGETPITGKTLTLEAGSVYTVDASETQCDFINLKELYDLCPIGLSAREMAELAGVDEAEMTDNYSFQSIYPELARRMEEQTSAVEADGQLDIGYSEASLAGVAFLKGKLCIGVQVPDGEQELDLPQGHPRERADLRTEASVTDLLDRRTNSKSLWSRGGSFTADDGSAIVFTIFERDDFTEEDLAFLTPVITCERKELISQGQWTLSYTFSESLTKNLKTDIVKSLTEGSIQYTDARISVMGVSLYGRWLDYVEGVSPCGGAAPYRPEIKAILKDGSEIELTWNQSSMTDATGGFFKYKYILEDRDSENHERRFIDQELLDSMAGISVDGTLIPIQ